MNYFMIAIGIQYIGATIWEYHKSKLLALVYVCYGISAIALAGVR